MKSDTALTLEIFEEVRRRYRTGDLVTVKKNGELVGKGRLIAHGIFIESNEKTCIPFNYVIIKEVLSEKRRHFLLEEGMEIEFFPLGRKDVDNE